MFCFEVSTFRLSHKHSQTKKIEFSFNSYVGVSFMHACVRACMFSEALFSDVSIQNMCITLPHCVHVCVFLSVFWHSKNGKFIAPNSFHTRNLLRFDFILFCYCCHCLIVVYYSILFNQIVFSLVLKSNSLWIYGTGKTHSKNVFRETTHITHWTEWLVLQLHKSSTLKKHWIDDDLTLAEALPNWIELTREREQRNEKKKIN